MNSEADVVHKKINPFLENLEYSQNIDGEIEYEKTLFVGKNRAVFPDIVINIKNKPSFVIEAKKTGDNLNFYCEQVISYGLLLSVRYALLTDGERIIIIDTKTEKKLYDGEPEVNKKIDFLYKVKLEKQIDEIPEFSKDKIKKAQKTLITFDDLAKFTEVLGGFENMIKDNDCITGSDAFDEIAKILFIKIYYEKREIQKHENEINIHNIKTRGVSYFREYIFGQVKKSNTDIFNKDDTINLKDETILKIIEILQDYKLLQTNIDIKGRSFEIFLGRTLTGSLGQYFTPRTIVKLMVRFCIDYLQTFTEKNICKIIDPPCGRGGFLIDAFQMLSNDNKDNESYVKSLSRDAIFGSNINPRLARVAKMNMILHGDGYSGISNANGLELDENNFYDLVIRNPPFGSNDDAKEVLQNFEFGKEKYLKKNGKTKSKEQLREIFKNIKEEYIEIEKEPSCFFIKPELITNRIDATYFYAEYIYKPQRKSDRIFNVADIVKNNKNLHNFPNEEFQYIQFSNVDSKLGSITGFELILGEGAPDIARQLVKAGDIICTRVKDSEENIAIIPSSLNNAIVSTGFAVFRAKPPMTSEALYVLLKHNNNLFQVRYRSSGTIMPSISNDDYSKNIIPYLNDNEIENIAAKMK